MAEDVARAVGAGAPDEDGVTVAGKKCIPRPLSLKELTELERDCLSKYRRSYVLAYSENADLLGPVEGPRLVREKLDEAAKFEIQTLPRKDVHDPKRLKYNEKVEAWLRENFDEYGADEKAPKELVERTAKRMVATALDQGVMSAKVYQDLTGYPPFSSKVGYVNWWITGTFEGMISMIHLSFRDSGVTRDEVALEIGRNPKMLIDLSRQIEHLSAPEVGNG